MVYLDLFLSFLKIGLFTIGGGYAMIPLISDTAIGKGWITEDLLIDFIAIAESTPGPFAVNVGTFIGLTVGGAGGINPPALGQAIGVICTVLGLLIPSIVIMLAIFFLSKKMLSNKHVQNAFRMIRPTVTALIVAAFLSVIYATVVTKVNSEETTFNWFGLLWFAICFFLTFKPKINKDKFPKLAPTMSVLNKIKLHPILLIILSAGVGILFYGFIL
ncbi:MAG: chromate transporter [Clostridia bacterium]|nr:chromate transporter [Clostridia bacterium]MBO7155855.1 chromate transporter [Clostridia bacterium]